MLGKLLEAGVRPEQHSAGQKRRVRITNALGLLFIAMFFVAVPVTTFVLKRPGISVVQMFLLVLGGVPLLLNRKGREQYSPYFIMFGAPVLLLTQGVILQQLGMEQAKLMPHIMPKIIQAILIFFPVILVPFRNTWKWRLNFLPGIVCFFLVDVFTLHATNDAMAAMYYSEKLFILNVGLLAPMFLIVASTAYLLRLNEKNENEIRELHASEAEKNRELDAAHNEILDSIRYAKRIQTAILPERSYMQSFLPELAVFYKPKDVVSGDFYWFAHLEQPNISVIAAVDCTGHGVPGAFMSVIGYNMLNRIVLELEITEPDVILSELDRNVRLALKQDEAGSSSHDGMDLALCAIRHNDGELDFAGAQRPLVIFRGGELSEYKGDKFPVGGAQNAEKFFTKQTFACAPGDRFYLYSDGYPDQFGGPKGRKFTPKRLRALVESVQELPMQQQEDRFAAAFYEWKGGRKQLDDVTLLGFEAG